MAFGSAADDKTFIANTATEWGEKVASDRPEEGQSEVRRGLGWELNSTGLNAKVRKLVKKLPVLCLIIGLVW